MNLEIFLLCFGFCKCWFFCLGFFWGIILRFDVLNFKDFYFRYFFNLCCICWVVNFSFWKVCIWGVFESRLKWLLKMKLLEVMSVSYCLVCVLEIYFGFIYYFFLILWCFLLWNNSFDKYWLFGFCFCSFCFLYDYMFRMFFWYNFSCVVLEFLMFV